MSREVYGKRTYKINVGDYGVYEERGVKNVRHGKKKRGWKRRRKYV
jgi:hypothetical protein